MMNVLHLELEKGKLIFGFCMELHRVGSLQRETGQAERDKEEEERGGERTEGERRGGNVSIS